MAHDVNNRYRTLSEAVDDLQHNGYTDELTLDDNGFSMKGKALSPEDFRIDSFHRFEGPTDPADMSIVYAVSSDVLGLKGLLVNAYGTYASGIMQRMVNALDAHGEQGERKVKPVQPAPPGADVKA